MNNVSRRPFTVGEELANAISHLTGAILGAVALTLMVIFSARYGSAWHTVSSSIFGGTMVILYLSSTLNHWLPVGKSKEFFFAFDQIAIYLLIAGTYTPFTLIALHGTLGWVIFGIEWGLALLGFLIKVFRPGKYAKGVNLYFILSYIIMGWLIVIAVPSTIEAISFAGFMWVVIGGLCYTAGTFFYRWRNLLYHHLIWHILVIMGSISHFIAIYFYVLPIQLPL